MVQFHPAALKYVHTGACVCDQQDHEVEITALQKQRVVWVYARDPDIKLWLTLEGILSPALVAGESHFAKHLGVNWKIK